MGINDRGLGITQKHNYKRKEKIDKVVIYKSFSTLVDKVRDGPPDGPDEGSDRSDRTRHLHLRLPSASRRLLLSRYLLITSTILNIFATSRAILHGSPQLVPLYRSGILLEPATLLQPILLQVP